MKAILVKEKGGPENLILTDYEMPVPREGYVLIAVKAFGINRAELYMRKGDWGDTADIIGIECVGVVVEDPSGGLTEGQSVAAMVGGMARTINGSYAEYVLVPKSNVIPFRSGLPWNELAAIPEAYATAWGILNWGLDARAGETLLIRGGTSTIGMAGIILAKQMGMTVIATTRSEEKIPGLKELGVDEVVIDNGDISRSVLAICPDGVDKLMELIGTPTLADSFRCTRAMGSVCLAGFLGGLMPMEQFQPIFQLPNSIRLTTLASALAFGQKGFELSKIPLARIIRDIEEGRIPNILRKTFPAACIGEAHRAVEGNRINGKVVVQW
jgi:NADPH:quinone reductase-like Zn-dependent oxidoreductase